MLSNENNKYAQNKPLVEQQMIVRQRGVTGVRFKNLKDVWFDFPPDFTFGGMGSSSLTIRGKMYQKIGRVVKSTDVAVRFSGHEFTSKMMTLFGKIGKQTRYVNRLRTQYRFNREMNERIRNYKNFCYMERAKTTLGYSKDQIPFGTTLLPVFITEHDEFYNPDNKKMLELRSWIERYADSIRGKQLKTDFFTNPDRFDSLAIEILEPYNKSLFGLMTKIKQDWKEKKLPDKTNPFPFDKVAFQLCFGVRVMGTSLNVMHRDVKPANIMVKPADVGTLRETDGKTTDTVKIIYSDRNVSSKSFSIDYKAGEPLLKIIDFDTVVFKKRKFKNVVACSSFQGTKVYFGPESLLHVVLKADPSEKDEDVIPENLHEKYHAYRPRYYVADESQDIFACGVIMMELIYYGVPAMDGSRQFAGEYFFDSIRRLHPRLYALQTRELLKLQTFLQKKYGRRYAIFLKGQLNDKSSPNVLFFIIQSLLIRLVDGNPLSLKDKAEWIPDEDIFNFFTKENNPAFWDTMEIIKSEFLALYGSVDEVLSLKNMNSKLKRKTLIDAIRQMLSWKPDDRRSIMDTPLFAQFIYEPESKISTKVFDYKKTYDGSTETLIGDIIMPTRLFTFDQQKKTGTSLRITVEKKTKNHPFYGMGSAYCYYINGKEPSFLTLTVGTIYNIVINTPGHPVRWSLSKKGGKDDPDAISGSTMLPSFSDWDKEGYEYASLMLKIEPPLADTVYIVCSRHDYMSIKVTFKVDSWTDLYKQPKTGAGEYLYE